MLFKFFEDLGIYPDVQNAEPRLITCCFYFQTEVHVKSEKTTQKGGRGP